VAVSGHGGSGRGWLRAVVLAVTVEGEAGLCAVERRSIFFSSASGGRSGGCRGGSDVDDLRSCWLPWRLGLLLEEEGAATRGVGRHCGMKKAGICGGVGSRWKRTGLASGCCSSRYC
jgi:hypothetical protein